MDVMGKMWLGPPHPWDMGPELVLQKKDEDDDRDYENHLDSFLALRFQIDSKYIFNIYKWIH